MCGESLWGVEAGFEAAGIFSVMVMDFFEEFVGS
jgi:hypothetical protein